MASSPLQAFDPHAKHYFTSHGTPSTYYAPARAPYPGPHSSSLPTQQTPALSGMPGPATILRSPQPRTPTQQNAQQPVFTQFTKDRASPDLPDVKLRKKASCAWDALPAPVASSAAPPGVATASSPSKR
ncbi:hypothetical protein BKA62DRAFT_764837 [Auriculariales sp. MPI-PUGE-AT-0066]|nr:hypothetical protein BKA62DRAFT_764837 [Auriculariales sp. MPI-PUGE-AT-0066]